MKVANRRIVRRLSWQSLKANRTRNLIAILAIALTAMLFTSLFTIALSINAGIQQANFRQVGGYSHGGFKYLNEAQYDALRDDPLIAEAGLRRILGMPMEAPFNKAHVELGYSDATQAQWMYCTPVEGRLPQEGTNEAATDLRVLALLGVEPELGATFTLTFDVDGHETTQTFTLCGWWDYDENIVASHILVPESRVNAVLEEVGVTAPGSDGMTGSWNLDVMLASGARHIEADLLQILTNHGYQSEDVHADNYIDIGVNWGYTGARLSDNLDPLTTAAIAGLLVLILLTGYLIIYNVFQISVAGDIRFYGLLKTIGTTPRQLRRMIRLQALALSALGIPLGLGAGWLMGRVLMPVIVAQLDGITLVTSTSPWIFVGAALFALATVFISCLRPGRMAGRVSPLEALRYTEGATVHSGQRRRDRVSLLSMAVANLGRSRGKTVVTICSLALAVVLLTMTVTFVRGFDMDKYVSNSFATDFQLADAGYFQTSTLFSPERALGEDAIAAVNGEGGITAAGRTYGMAGGIQELVSEDWFRSQQSRWYDAETVEAQVQANATDTGQLAADVQLYGMEAFCLDQLEVVAGSLEGLYEPGSRMVAAVVSEDDYGNVMADSHWAQVGDTLTLRVVEEWEYVDSQSGAVLTAAEADAASEPVMGRAKSWREETYTVAALVVVPSSLSYRYYGSDEFVMNAETFIADTGRSDILYYAFNTDEAATADMETFLADYTEGVATALDYESKATYIEGFNDLRNMFSLTGGALSAIVALVGVLNFFNAILTGIASRRRELAMLRAIGMTGRQLRRMLALEGLLYTLGALAVAALLTVALAPLLPQVMESVFWFFSYHFTIWPILALLPVFAAIGVFLPLLCEGVMARRSIVERLRQD